MLGISVSVLLLLVGLSFPVAVVIGCMAYFLGLTFSPLPLHLAFGEVLWTHSTSFLLIVVPLFVMMGEIIVRSGIANRMYAAVVQWVSWLPGGLMHANIIASAMFAATSGSSAATAATIGVTALPQAEQRGYNERLFLGSLAAGGTLGILIPPSMNMIIYAFLTNTSIPQLFIAGVVPGLLLALMFMVVILVACVFRPAWGGRRVDASWRERMRLLPDLLPPLVLFIVVIGVIYLGVATPTEAASIGVAGALALAAMYGGLTWKMIAEVFEGTIRTSAMMTLILIMSFILNMAIAGVGMVQSVGNFIAGLNMTPLGTMLLIIGVYLILGMFMDALAIVVLTVPIIAPIVIALGYDPVWFGVLLVVLTEAAILTPPVGMLCFIVQGIRQKGHLSDVFIGMIPFLATIFLMLGLLLAFPGIALWLPTLLYS